uniref:Uncharacterized protein n=1 Tax=Arundo donax TaxID=35708 RepID=A0A0A9FYP2_ARUDO
MRIQTSAQSAKPSLDALKQHAIGTLDLLVTPWVCHGSVADFDAEFFIEILKFNTFELCPKFNDNPIKHIESGHNVLEEL